MAAGATYEPIATQTLSSASSSVTFNSIPSTYTDLILIGSFQQSASAALETLAVRFNGDTGTNYSHTGLQGTGAAASSFRASSASNMLLGYQNVIGNGNIIIQIPNYSNTAINKTAISRQNNGAGITFAIVGLWRSTAAINQLVFSCSASSFASSSMFTLYGIAAA